MSIVETPEKINTPSAWAVAIKAKYGSEQCTTARKALGLPSNKIPEDQRPAMERWLKANATPLAAEPERSALHIAALAYAAKGWPVFPCVTDSKAPACPHGHKDATLDIEQINAWWSTADYNIGLEPEQVGMGVIDADTYKTDCEIEDLFLPDTYEVQTPRSGTHYYFKGSLPPSAGTKLGKGIDTRGRGSYVLLPPSVVDGKPYAVKHDREVAELPAEIAVRLATANTSQKSVVEDLDQEANIGRAETLLLDCVKRGDVAIEGSGGNNRTYRLAAEVQALGITKETCLALLEGLWNSHCLPPWEHEEMARVVENATNYMQNEAGANAVDDAALKENARNAEAEHQSKAKTEQPSRKLLWRLRDLWKLPDPEPLVDNLLMQRENVSLFGPAKIGKSFAALDMALSIATGLPVFGRLTVRRSGPAVYFTGEGRHGFKRRIAAWAQARGFEDLDAFLDEVPFYFVPEVPQTSKGIEACDEYYDAICAELGPNCYPVLAVVDTMARSMAGLNENDAGDVGRYLAMTEHLRAKLACTLVTIAHTGKDESKGQRGSSAQDAGFDTMLQAEGDPDKGVLKIGHGIGKDSEKFSPHHLHLRSIVVAGMAHGRTAVVEPITAGQYQSGTRDAATGSDASRSSIVRMLVRLRAHTWATGHSTKSLAEHLETETCPGQRAPTEDQNAVDEYEIAVGKRVTELNNGARKKLESLCQVKNGDRKWYIAEHDPEADFARAQLIADGLLPKQIEGPANEGTRH